MFEDKLRVNIERRNRLTELFIKPIKKENVQQIPSFVSSIRTRER